MYNFVFVVLNHSFRVIVWVATVEAMDDERYISEDSLLLQIETVARRDLTPYSIR